MVEPIKSRLHLGPLHVRPLHLSVLLVGLLAACDSYATADATSQIPGGDGGSFASSGPSAGLFLSQQNLDRARNRIENDREPYRTSYRNLRNRAVGYLDDTADPFHMPNMTRIVFAWSGDKTPGVDDSLRDAVNKYDIGSDKIRTLALVYALTGETKFADKAVEMMLAWSARHTPVNIYDFHPDFRNATIDGMTSGYSSERPWNFALDAMWQTYGLTNASDAYLLLTRNGYVLSSAERSAFRRWIRKGAEAVNSSFHAWTRWGDLHPGSGSYERYRTDNHLTWCHVGLLAAGVALGDPALQNYVLHGGSWYDQRAGTYTNPSYVFDVIDRAIESGTGSQNEGRVYEEKILRSPAVGYSIFHLQAMALVACIAQVHTSEDVWSYQGADSAGMMLALERYAAFVLGERQSPQAGENPRATFLYELAYGRWPTARFETVVRRTDRSGHIRAAIGPVLLLLGRDLP